MTYAVLIALVVVCPYFLLEKKPVIQANHISTEREDVFAEHSKSIR